MKKETILHKIGQLIVPLKRTMSPLEADSHSACGGHFFNRSLLLLLLLLTVGVNVAWGQGTDYSGTYYIGSKATKQNNKADSYTYNSEELANNYYLCPTEGWYFYNGDNNTSNGWTETDNGKPFLTTYKCLEDGEYDVSKAVWVIEKKTNTDFYYIKQKKITANEKYRYLVSNRQITGTSSPRRMRVHLEEFADNETAFASLGDLALFEIATVPDDLASNCLYIIPHSSNGRNGSELYLVVNDGNYNNLTAGATKGDGPNGTYGKNTQGTIGVYSTEPNGYWTLEVPRPVISFNASNQVEITDPTGFASAIYYTTNGDDPTVDPSNLYSVAFDPDDDVTTIKAIAIVDGQESGVTTFTPPFFLGSTHNYIIQSKDCKFYNMIPNLSVDANTKNVSTLNVPCSTMAWHFEYAEEGYYYIVDVNGWYMYYTTTGNTSKYIYLKSSKDDSDGFKFKIASHTNGGYNIIPKGQTKAIYKNNNGDAGLTPVRYDGNIAEAVSRWDIIPYTTTNLPMWDNSPFDVSNNNDTYYYTITPLSKNTDSDWQPLILNNDGLIKSDAIPTSNYDSRKSLWVIKIVGAYHATNNPNGDNDELLDYYTFQNAYTGEQLYYNGAGKEVKTNASPGVLQMGMPEVTGADVTWSHFVIVQTRDNGYNIIPRVLVDNTKATSKNSTHEAFNCINRANGGNFTGTWFDNDGGSRWTFGKKTDVPVPCMDPVFTETNPGTGNIITLSCVTNASQIFYTTDGSDPQTSETAVEYNANSWPSSAQKLIKAFAKLKNDDTDGSNSSVVTLFNNPDITLSQDTYTYNGAAKTPEISEVSITINGVKTTAASDTYEIDEYVNNTNAGSPSSENPPTVKLKDVAGDDLYIWNASEKFTIAPKGVTFTAASGSKTYDSTALTESGFTATALEEGDTHEFIVAMTPGSTITNVGTQPNVIATVDGTTVSTEAATPVGNYSVTIENGTLTINPKSVTITASDASKTYNGLALIQTEFTATPLETGDDHTFTVVMTDASTITNVGTQPNVIATVDGTTVSTEAATPVGNYSVTIENGTLTINPKAVTITASDASKTYDGAALTENDFEATALEEGDDHTFTVVMTEGSTITDVGTQPNVIATVDGVAVTTGTGTAVGNYQVTTENGTLTINKAVLTVTANDKTITYGEAPANAGVTYDGFVNSETTLVLGGELTYTYNYAQYEDVGSGSFAIILSGLTSDNYDIRFVDGTLTVEQKEVGFGEWSNTTVTYNGSAQAPTITVTTGTVNGDVVGVEVTGGINAGSYTAIASGLTGAKAGNYKLPDPAPTSPFTINKARLMAVNLENDAFTYNGEEQSVTIMSVTAGDGTVVTVSNVPSDEYDVSGNSATNAGTHTVTVTPKSPSTNYDTDVSQSTSFTIDKKSIGDGTDPATASGITIDITWNDNESIPYTVEVKDGESLLTAGTEGTEYAYSLSAIGNHDTKYYTVTITGANNYNGSFTSKYANVSFDSDGSPGAMYYGTFVAEANHAIPAGMTPYIITSVADNTATAKELDYIPNGEPVVLMNPTYAKGFQVQSGTGEISTTGNKLEVQAADEEKATAFAYLLYKGEFVLNKAGVFKAGMVYLPVSAGGGSARLKISRGGNTGIEDIEYTIDSQSGAWYSLDGRRLSSKPTKKGIYLQNGKKIVVK